MNVFAAVLVAAATLRGTVFAEGMLLPGCTVILDASPSKLERVTDAHRLAAALLRRVPDDTRY